MSFKEKVCGRTHRRTTEDGQRPITMPYLEPLAFGSGELKKD